MFRLLNPKILLFYLEIQLQTTDLLYLYQFSLPNQNVLK